MKIKLNSTSDLVSVLVPMYNAEKTIARCIKSILKQTHKNLEIILLDDGSTDQTYEIAKTFAVADKRIKLLRKENEKNISKTRNFLLDHFSGNYFVWVDSDDVVHKNYMARLLYTIKSQNADLGICGYQTKLTNSPFIQSPFHKTCVYENLEMYQKIILTQKVGFMLWNKIFKKDLLEKIRFDESLKFGEDFGFTLDYLNKCKKIAFNNSKLYKYILHSNSATTKKFAEDKLSFAKYLELRAQNETNPHIKSMLLGWLAFTGTSMLFLAKRAKYENFQHMIYLHNLAQQYKKDFYHNRVALLPRIIMFFGLKTWARKQPKQKQLKIKNEGN